MRFTLLLLLSFMLTPCYAIGIGSAAVYSELGQTLVLEIPLVGAQTLDKKDILVTIGSNQDYQALGATLEPFHHTLRFTVLRTQNENAIVMVTSTQPVNEPYLYFVIKITTPNETLLKEITVLVDTST